MADYSYKYSHINLSKFPPQEYKTDDLLKKEAKLKSECRKRIENSTTTELGRKLIWHHIFTTTKA